MLNIKDKFQHCPKSGWKIQLSSFVYLSESFSLFASVVIVIIIIVIIVGFVYYHDYGAALYHLDTDSWSQISSDTNFT